MHPRGLGGYYSGTLVTVVTAVLKAVSFSGGHTVATELPTSMGIKQSSSLTLTVCMYVCMYVRMYVCMYVCIYIYIYVYMCICLKIDESHPCENYNGGLSNLQLLLRCLTTANIEDSVIDRVQHKNSQNFGNIDQIFLK